MTDLNLRHFEGALDVIDIQHPGHLDWRRVKLSIDLDEGRWFHFAIQDKPGGRSRKELAACPIFKQVVNIEARNLVDIAFPDREKDVLPFLGDMVYNDIAQKAIKAGLDLSIHTNAVSQRFICTLSNHQWLSLSRAWADLISAREARRAAEVR